MLLGRTSRRWAVALLVVVSACLGILLGSASPASAHATLIDTDPAPGEILAASPEQVRFTFDETISAQPDAVRAWDAGGSEIDATNEVDGKQLLVGVPADLASGSYVITWRVVSADGHPISGSLTFSVGEPSLSIAAPKVTETDASVTRTRQVAAGASYVGLLAALGLALFAGLVAPASLRADRGSARQALARITHLGLIAGGLAVVGQVVLAPATQLDQQAGALGDLADLSIWLDGLAASAVSVVGLAGGLALLWWGVTRSDRLLLLTGGAIVAFIPALSGHTRAVGPLVPMVLTDVAHVSAAAVWLGGLVAMVLVMPSLVGRPAVAMQVLSRFSTAAAGTLVVLVAAGALLAWRIAGSWEVLFEADYGRLILTKGGLVAVAVLLAAANRYVLMPRIVAGGHDERAAAADQVSQFVRVEAALVIAAALVSGFLANTTPKLPEPDAGETSAQVSALGPDLKVIVLASPPVTGPGTVRFQIQDRTGEPYQPTRRPSLRVRTTGSDLGAIPVTPDAAGTWRAEVVLPIPGKWEFEVSVRVDEFTNPVGVATIEIAPATQP